MQLKDVKDYDLPVKFTAMIDIVFLLLIFFLLTPFRRPDEVLKAHGPTGGDGPPQVDIHVEISRRLIERQPPHVRVGTHEVPLAELDRKLLDISGGDRRGRVRLDGKKDVRFQYVMAALDECAEAGMKNVSCSATPDF